MNLVKKYPFKCTECGEFTIYQNKRNLIDGCVRRHYCSKCSNTYVVKYSKNGNIVGIVDAYKKVKI